MRAAPWALLLATCPVRGLRNGLDLVPPMGWSNWLAFGCNIDEQLFRRSADALVSKGLRDAGYTTVGVDDCWAELGRNASGHLVPNRTMFPSGMEALADYLHARGLKLRIYSSAGLKTCQGNMSGSLGYEWLDAQLFASWGVDALKYDDCYQGQFEQVLQDSARRFPFLSPPILRYPVMAQALNRTGRSISYLCNFPWDFWRQEQDQALGGQWVAETCNSWRTGPDSQPGFDYSMGVLDGAEKWADAVPSGPGGWNHLDALQIGNGRAPGAGGGGAAMSEPQERALFSLFALAKTPLMIGADVTALSGGSLATYLNREVIAVSQDPLGAGGGGRGPPPPPGGGGGGAPPPPRPGRRPPTCRPDARCGACRLADGGAFVVLLNRNAEGSQPLGVPVSWGDLGMKAGSAWAVRDVWRRAELGVFSGAFRAEVPPQACVAVRLRRVALEALPARLLV